MRKRTKSEKAIKIALLILIAAIMAVGLEMLESKLLPKIYVESEAMANGAPTYLELSTGKLALRESWSALRLTATFVLQLAVLIILFPLGLGKAIWRALAGAIRSVKDLFTAGHWKNSLVHILLFLGTGAIAFLGIRALAMDSAGKSNWMIDLFSLSAATAVAMLFSFPKTLARKPEVFFLIFSLLIGGLLAFLLPDATTVSWDDGHHYQHALNYSTIGRVRFTEQDMIAMEAQNEKFYGLGEERQTWLKAQDEANRNGAVYVTSDFHMQPKQFWSGTQGLGLFLGRLFHLNYWMTWSLGRFTGLLAYALAGYFAIRRLYSGKMILTAVLMIPGAVFLASNYSYDPGVTCLTALGLSYCFSLWQNPDRKASRMDQIVMIGALFLGCIAKAIYFPLLLLPLFLPRDRFENVKQYRRFIWADSIAMILLLISFVLPMMFSDGSGDQRGGTDVNAIGQIRFILSNPLKYTETLLRFLGRYLDPYRSRNYLTNMAYMGVTHGHEIYLIILSVAAFTDRGSMDQLLGSRKGLRIFMLFLLFGTLCLVATSMYVSYTGVGKNNISGCQPRYLIPLIFPAMMLLGSGRIRNEGNRAVYNGLIFTGIGWVGFAAVLECCISLYG